MTITLSPICALILLSASTLLIIAGLFILFGWNQIWKKKRLPFETRIILFWVASVVSTALIKYMVGISGIFERTLSPLEEAVNSFLHTIQAFSLNEDFTTYYVQGKELIRILFPNRAATVLLYAIIVSIQNICCAISGGVVLYLILSRIFPAVRLAMESLAFWKPIYFFSAVNKKAIALARSIRAGNTLERKALFVFCAYGENADQSAAQEAEQAKGLGGILLSKELTEIPLAKHSKKIIFLVSDEQVNLRTLISLTSDEKAAKLGKKDAIYRFGNENEALEVDKLVRALLRQRRGTDVPFIFGINDFQSIVQHDILIHEPLFQAIHPAPDGTESLHVVIFGSDDIGTEAFLDTTWCGQILDCPLKISMLSSERREDFVSGIDRINKEILKGSTVDEPLLRVRPGNPNLYAPIYFSFDYDEFDPEHEDLSTLLNKEGRIDADYYIISLGNDIRNISFAKAIERQLTIETNGKRPAKVPVACVVHDDNLASILMNEQNEASAARVFPIGMLNTTYSFWRIPKRHTNDMPLTPQQGNSYERWIYDFCMKKEGSEEDIYAYGSHVARAVHTQYKAYSMKVSFDEYREKAESDFSEDARLAWLEHRRWNAYMRSIGFRCPTEDEEQRYIGQLPDVDDPQDKRNKSLHKSIGLKLHPCIVEADHFGNSEGAEDDYDYLDMLSVRFQQEYPTKNLKTENYKKYDYPIEDFH